MPGRFKAVIQRPLLASSSGVGAGAIFTILAVNTSPLMAAGILGGAILALGVFAWPFLGFALTSFVIPLERIGRLTDDSAVTTISLMRIIGTLTMAALIVQSLVRKRGLWLPTPVWLYTCYFLMLVLSAFHQDSLKEGIRGVSSMMANVVFLTLTVNVVKTQRHVRLAIVAWLMCTVAIGVFTIYQYHRDVAVTVNQWAASGMRTTEERFSTVLHDASEYEVLGTSIKRALGSTSDSAVYGINLILALPFYFWLARRERRLWVIIPLIASAAIVFYNALLTNTRAVVLTLGFCLIACVVLRVVRIRLGGWFAGVGLLVLLTPFIPTDIYDRVLSLANYTTDRSATLRYRFIYWQAALRLTADNPWFGVGAGNQTILPKSLKNLAMPPNASAHNEYINSLMEVGVIGYALLVCFMVSLFRRIRAAAKRFTALGDQDSDLLCRTILVGYLSVLFFALQADVLHFPLKGWWLAMGLAIVLDRISGNMAREAESQAVGEAVATGA